MMQTVRPKINEDLIRKIKMSFPKETAMLGNAETVEWAIKKALGCKIEEETEKMFPKVAKP